LEHRLDGIARLLDGGHNRLVDIVAAAEVTKEAADVNAVHPPEADRSGPRQDGNGEERAG